MQEVLDALAEPQRRRILILLRHGELSAGEIASHFAVTRPAISQHLGVLRAAGLVADRRAGTRRLYRLRPEGFSDLRAFLLQFWDDRLEQLRQVAEAEERIPRQSG
jgi:DNA-binding transcriptional ArsR family regulator